MTNIKTKLSFTLPSFIHKHFFWQHYQNAMQPHIEQIWGWDEQWQQQDFESRWQSCENQLIIHNGENIGYIQTQDLADELYIMMLIVLPEYRSMGIGKEAIDLLQQAQSKTLGLRVFKTNDRGLQFYQSNGFTVSSEEECFFYLHRHN